MNHSQCCVEILGVGRVYLNNAEIEAITKNSAGDATGILRIGDDAVYDGRKAIKGVSGTQLKYIPTSGVSLKATPGKTTTILGTYADDTGNILNELGNIKSMDFGINVINLGLIMQLRKMIL